ncbi:MAG: GNAT family N-acetyltransferase [Acidobacteria bacterium]|nr:GNAT family N-acetyltransferase [Acidobacteriota bacterium]MCA1640008.1 GNAT family N-acetyltransferase [Acidobacteriota bacterium]
MKVEEIILGGKFVSLVPLHLEHLDALNKVGLDESLWLWTINVIKNSDDMRRYVETALDEQRRGVALPFVTIEKSSEKIVGSTRFGNIDAKNRKIEIGWTWINPQWQKTFINTEAKLLMLTHAFETWKCVRVEFKTDALNEKSRKAILRLGAKEEGVLRRHMITDAGRLRDTVYFSIIDAEWKNVKSNLEKKLRSF